MARGMPSSRAHICATAAKLCADSSKAGLAAPTRAANSGPASDAATAAAEPSAGSPSGGTGKTSSPGTSRRSLLVARNRSRRHWGKQRGHQVRRRLQDVLAVVQHHQQLTAGQRADQPGGRGRRIPLGHAQGLRDAGRDQGRIGKRAQFDQPGAVPEAGLASAATRSASRVLPHPPGPVSVTTRPPPSRSRTAAISGPRPTSELTSAGSPGCCCGRRAVCAPP